MRRIVAIVVHGVGDHTPTNILHELETGLAKLPDLKAAMVSREPIPNFPLSAGKAGLQDTLKIELGNAEASVVPVVWSGWRIRATSGIEEFPPPIATPTEITETFARALPALVLLCINTFRCVPKARELKWRLLLSLFGLLVILGVLGVPFGLWYPLLYLPSYVWQKFLVPAGPRSFSFVHLLSALTIVLFSMILIFGIPTIAFFLYRKSLPVLDFVGDVVCYVGNDKRRSELERRMLEIVRFMAAHKPDAEILLVCHSLGSVLITHCLKELGAKDDLKEKIRLITLGSPLITLSRIFGGHVRSPKELLECYTNSAVVSFWVHMWRDSDLIGRGFFEQSIPPFREPTCQFTESSLGEGPHRNYWSDVRLWGVVLCFIRMGTAALPEDALIYKALPLTTEEEKELGWQVSKCSLFRDVFGPTFLFVVFTARDTFSRALMSAASARILVVIWVSWIGLVFLLSSMWISPIIEGYMERKLQSPPREQLERLRLLNGRLFLRYVSTIGLGIGYFMVRFFLVSLPLQGGFF